MAHGQTHHHEVTLGQIFSELQCLRNKFWNLSSSKIQSIHCQELEEYWRIYQNSVSFWKMQAFMQFLVAPINLIPIIYLLCIFYFQVPRIVKLIFTLYRIQIVVSGYISKVKQSMQKQSIFTLIQKDAILAALHMYTTGF